MAILVNETLSSGDGHGHLSGEFLRSTACAGRLGKDARNFVSFGVYERVPWHLATGKKSLISMVGRPQLKPGWDGLFAIQTRDYAFSMGNTNGLLCGDSCVVLCQTVV